MNTEIFTMWKDIKISGDLIGDVITKGDGSWQKEYRYIKIPKGCGYDNYCFMLSEKLVHLTENKGWWFSVCEDMKIELIYDPELREEKKRYSRYKLTGEELFEKVFKNYEAHFKEESEERLKKERTVREKRLRATMGTVICGRYTGNIYGNITNNYHYQDYLSSFFKSEAGTCYNKKFDKVQNVKREFVVMNMSKYHFIQYEDIINAYVSEYEMYKNICDTLTRKLEQPKKIVTHTEEIAETQLYHCQAAMEDVKKKLMERLTELLENDL